MKEWAATRLPPEPILAKPARVHFPNHGFMIGPHETARQKILGNLIGLRQTATGLIVTPDRSTTTA